jgi:predicted pyridoxine 5'-phosphate oxidase superfamily flavin-nucleotide-binding protein
MKMQLTQRQIDFINKNGVCFFATADSGGRPRVISVMPSIVAPDRIVLADMQMNASRKNISENKNVFLLSADSGAQIKISGAAEYASGGDLFDKVKNIESERCPEFVPRGIIIIDMESISETNEEQEK